MKKHNVKENPVITWAHRSSSNERLKAMTNVVKSDVAIKQSQLDQNLWLFNCLNGTIDLKTGGLLPHQRDNYITEDLVKYSTEFNQSGYVLT